jgi:hypothetical protein
MIQSTWVAGLPLLHPLARSSAARLIAATCNA